jgi:hypothetical protein
LATTTEDKTMIDLIRYPNEIDNDPSMQVIREIDFHVDGTIRQILKEALFLIEQKESIEHRHKEFPDYESILARQDIALGNLICKAHRIAQLRSEGTLWAEAALGRDDD